MRSANRPAGPGKPTNERRDQAVEAEELNELADTRGNAAESDEAASRDARQAERAAHTRGEKAASVSGTSRDRTGRRQRP